jgi:glycosyltransferase involved in cell wall biosynthesis
VKILFVTDHTYPPHRVGGAESSTHELALTLQQNGIEVAVLAASPVAGFFVLGRPLPPHRLRRARPRLDRVMGYPVFRSHHPVRAADQTLERFPASAVVVTSGTYAPLSQAFLRRGVPTIVYLRDVELGNMGGELPREPLATYLSNSSFNAARVAAALGIQSVVMPPLIRTERYNRYPSTRTRALFINPVPQKGVDLAFRLAEARRDIPFDFVECWGLSRQTRERLLARARPLSNLAWHPVTDSSRLYCHARIVLVPSVWEESWGRVVTEAHCCGIPVLASRRGGLPESVGPGGLLVDHDASLEAWCSALSRMWDDHDTYEALAAAARRHSERHEIQPQILADKFIAFVGDHIAHSR